MKTFEVYSRLAVNPVRGQGAKLWDDKGQAYLDFYGGHAVISIGHSHPHYLARLEAQMKQLAFYSNAVENPLQETFASKLGEMSGLEDYDLFLCNSGAEANENALKLASFYTGKSKIISFTGAFHGRTSAAVEATDNRSIQAPINQNGRVIHLPFNDSETLRQTLEREHQQIAAVIVESIQGVGGVQIARPDFLRDLRKFCAHFQVILIVDEIQAGYGRSGDFFAFQSSGILPDLISIAKGMGNGFPIGGVLISPKIQAVKGQLGTTFGGNHLACAAGLAVLEVLEKEALLANAKKMGEYLEAQLESFSKIKELRARGLMIGLEFDFPINELRQKLLHQHHIFTGSSGSNTLRLLPPLCLSEAQAEHFVNALAEELAEI